MKERLYFSNLKHQDFMHPTDSKALAAIKMLKGLPALINWKNKIYNEKLIRILSMGDDIRVTKKTFKQIYEMTEFSAKVLGTPIPDVFIDQSPIVNAITIGTDAPMIRINSGLIDLMNEVELQAVIAHEMGHIKCGHVLYKTVADLIKNGKSLFGPFRIVFDYAIAFTLLEWDRKSEFSADRAALLVIQDVKPVISMLMKLAGGSQKIVDQIDHEDFLEQSRQFGVAVDGVIGKVCKLELTLNRSHPFPVMRAAEIECWSKTSEYQKIISRGETECPVHRPIGNAPIGLSAESGLKRAIKLKWNAPPFCNISGYKVYRSEDPTNGYSFKEVSGRDETEFEDKSLGDGKTYYYFVKAKDLYGNDGEPTAVVIATTKIQPAPVENIFPEGDLVRKATLRWIAASNHGASMKINVYRSDSTPDKFKKIATVLLSDGIYQDTGLGDNCTYFYQVVVDDDGICSDLSKKIMVCTKKLIDAPNNMKAKYSRGTLSLEWSEVQEAANYEVYDDGAIYDSKIGKSSSPYFRMGLSLKPGKKAVFYVKAVDHQGRKSDKSEKVAVHAI
jgi:fibronectin type 3 domain-containing protein